MPRCAIYTRKSTEEGLEQDFNSLDAQREACEAFIKSQHHEGWRLIREHFDDGGSSGGTMNRPALTHLLAAIKRREVDIVVVYKVDRLTRSLADFAKMVELFDAHGVSFVSVTQQFNTTTSMGRLTLNVLLSFAQFEREVTAERIRDKIAASKKKGMWMGGPPPLGYDVKDRKLVINEGEARIVRKLFQLYLELGSVRRLKAETDRLGVVTKRRKGNGNETGGKPFTRGNLYQLLGNPLYVGRIPHKGESYPGQHEAIVSAETWETVQRTRAQKASQRRCTTNTNSHALLSGLIFDETGNRLGPTYTGKNGKRYRYYVSPPSDENSSGWRLPAEPLENIVIGTLKSVLQDPHRLIGFIDATSHPDTVPLSRLQNQSKKLADKLGGADRAHQRSILEQLVCKIDLSPTSLAFKLSRNGLLRLIDDHSAAMSGKDETIPLAVPLELRRRGVETKLIVSSGETLKANRDPTLCRLVAQGRLWFDQLAAGKFATVREIARANKMPECDVSRTLRLAFLAPEIVTAIIEGRQPVDLTAETFRRLSTLPADWETQRQLFWRHHHTPPVAFPR